MNLKMVLTLLVSTVLMGCISTPEYHMAQVPSKTITKIVAVEDTSKNDLYLRANDWMVDTFNNADSVIQFSDKEGGVISGKYRMGVVDSVSNTTVNATIKIKVKDNAAKMDLISEDFKYLLMDAESNAYTRFIGYSEKELDLDMEKLVHSFEGAMRREPAAW
jgi:type IV pilus biogenesis protein CpaD/CtpE